MVRACVSDVAVGQVVRSVVGSGRAFKVLRNEEFVNYQDGTRQGPYCRLQALDDRNIQVIYPRDWYTTPGQSLPLFEK